MLSSINSKGILNKQHCLCRHTAVIKPRSQVQDWFVNESITGLICTDVELLIKLTSVAVFTGASATENTFLFYFKSIHFIHDIADPSVLSL